MDPPVANDSPTGHISQSQTMQVHGIQELLAAASRNPNLMNIATASAPAFSYQDVLSQFQPQYANLLQLLSEPPGAAVLGAQPQPHATSSLPQENTGMQSARAKPSRSADTRLTNTGNYASRHQQAEARRRSRINERLDALRKLVPHTERANTAVFLEDVIRYVQRMQHRVVELERSLGLAPSIVPSTAPLAFCDATPEATAGTSSSAGVDRLAIHAVLQQAAAVVAGLPTPMSNNTNQRPPGQAGRAETVLPSASEELAMAAHLAPPREDRSGATMAESRPIKALTIEFEAKEAKDMSADHTGEGELKCIVGTQSHAMPVLEPSGIDHNKRRRT